MSAMFIEAAVIGLVVGYIRGGRLSNLKNLSIKRGWAVLIAFLLQFGLGRLPLGVGSLHYAVHMLSYLLLFYFVWVNFQPWGIRLIGLGIMLNFVVIAANNGIMPVGTAGMSQEFSYNLQTVSDGIHGLLTGATRLPILADIIKVKNPLTGSGGWYSIGDIVMDLGIIVLISSIMANISSYYKVVSVKGGRS